MQELIYVATPEFKTMVGEILATKKFSAVFSFMNLIKRDGFRYTENELNQLVQFMGEFAYNEVSDFFQQLSSMIAVEENKEAAKEAEQHVKAWEKVELETVS